MSHDILCLKIGGDKIEWIGKAELEWSNSWQQTKHGQIPGSRQSM